MSCVKLFLNKSQEDLICIRK